MDELRLIDETLDVLKNGKLSNRPISELLARPDVSQFIVAMEIYIDRKVQPQISTVNAMYKFAGQARKESATGSRICERFNAVTIRPGNPNR